MLSGDECQCNQVEGECQIKDDNFIEGIPAKSEFHCSLYCSSNDKCKYYTWFSSENEDIFNECFLFSSCQTVNGCNGGCYVGGVNCHQPTTITPEITTTTEKFLTTYPGICDDIEYEVLDDETRNMNYGLSNHECYDQYHGEVCDVFDPTYTV